MPGGALCSRIGPRDTDHVVLRVKDGYERGGAVCDDPLIWVVDDFVEPDECDHLLALADGRMADALVSRLGEDSTSERRTGEVCWLRHDESAVVAALVGRVATFVGLPRTHAENLQVVHYAETQEYQPHYDAWDVSTPKGEENTAQGGNRAVTALMYLSEPAGGGATAFPNLGLELEARPGRLVVFHNLATGSGDARHVDALHGGTVVTSGEKWACNLWFRERPYQRPERPQ